jgi:tetratricopeptide (TPR) repeat protein
MDRNLLAGLVVAFGIGVGFSACKDRSAQAPPPVAEPPKTAVAPAPPPTAPVGATLLEGLGNHKHAITTSNPEAQRWFDQGLMLTFGFNHDAAERSFLKATEKDPQCAMCWWGAALVLGPHVNAGMDPANNGKAWMRVQKARELAANATDAERAYIEALATRYAENPPEDRKPLDQAYAKATGELVKKLPDDLDAATFHAEALMDLQPWDYYDAQLKPKGGTAEVVSVLESVMKRNADHAGALHLYVHAVEASADPQRGVAAADRLRELIPGSGHLVHMPAHIYGRVGRWHDAVLANQKAIEADNAYLATCRPAPGVYPLGYVPHNHHFLWFAATMEGASAVALAAADETAKRTSDPQLMRTPGFEAMQYFALTPVFAKVRFGKWDEIKALPKPPDDLPYQVAMWHYAQAIVAVRQNRMEDAGQHATALSTAAADPVIEKMMVWDRYPLSHGVKVADRTVAAEIAAARKDYAAAIGSLKEAVAIEDQIPYDEPPGWHLPSRQTLGAVLLAAGKAAEAEAVYREELRRNPENGWSLAGLAESLKAQKKVAAAKDADQRLKQALTHADLPLTSSRL